MRVTFNAETGISWIPVVSKASSAASGSAQPGRVSEGTIDAGVALAAQWSEAGEAQRVAATVNDDELFYSPFIIVGGLVRLDVEM